MEMEPEEVKREIEAHISVALDSLERQMFPTKYTDLMNETSREMFTITNLYARNESCLNSDDSNRIYRRIETLNIAYQMVQNKRREEIVSSFIK